MGRLLDIETTAKIKFALMTNPHVGGLDIGVDTVNGIVFLTGAVQDLNHKVLSEEIARAHGGIDIKNDIEVLGEPPELSEAGIEEREAGISIEEDMMIRDRVAGDLESDGRVNAFMINVDVVSGIVRLSGIQDNAEGYRRAEEIARRVQGVRDVINEIEIRHAA